MVLKLTYTTLLRIYDADNNKLSTAVVLRNQELVEVKERGNTVKNPFSNVNEWFAKYPNATQITVGDNKHEPIEDYVIKPSSTDVSGSPILDLSGSVVQDLSGSVVKDLSGSVVKDLSGSVVKDLSGSTPPKAKWFVCCSSASVATLPTVPPLAVVSDTNVVVSVMKRVPTATDMTSDVSGSETVVLRTPVEVAIKSKWLRCWF